MPGPQPVTQLLERINAGDASASDLLLPLVYDELRQLAAAVFARRDARTLQATALVHEAFLKLLGPGGQRNDWSGRRHFFAVAAIAMRRVLSDYVRDGQRLKRGGGEARQTIHDGLAEDAEVGREMDLFDLDAALTELEQAMPRIAHVVKLRFFAGMTVEEVAQQLSITERSVYKDWRTGRAWLRTRLDGEDDE